MSNVLKKITTRAKAIRKAHPGVSWKSAIKRAGAEYRGRFRQTGRSKRSADIQRKARRPGKRKSRSGVPYYERRKNRSDKPGTLTGVPVTDTVSVSWRDVRNKKLAFVSKGLSYTTLSGRLIYWEYQERANACRWLAKHKAKFR